jgi:hypothetical protein
MRLAADGLLALLLGQVAPAAGSDSLAGARAGLESPRAAERATAAAALRRSLRAEELDAALAALQEWPPTPALHLRELLVDLPLLREGLLERATREPGGELARELLADALRARAAALAPFRADEEAMGGPRLPWSDHGVTVRRVGAPRASLGWFGLRRALDDAGAFSQPVAWFPRADAGVEGDRVGEPRIPAPLVAQAPAESWLAIELSRRGRVALRRLVATWIVPAELAPPEGRGSAGRRGFELAELGAHEEELLRAALRELAARPPFERGLLGGDLLASLGLPCAAPTATPSTDEFARGVAASLALHRLAPPAPKPADSADRPVEGPPAAGSTEERKAALLAAAESVASGALAGVEARDALRDRVDALADRLEGEALLGGELAERLRRRAAELPAGSPAAAQLETAAGELWILGRGSRPGTSLVELPRGEER